jgi:RNA polymerase sigma-70 factor (ECF subfamily)
MFCDLQFEQQKMSVQKPNKKEFSELIEKHQAIIHKVTMIYTNGSADREDLFQEICLQLWKSYPSFRKESKFSTWMYRVSLNTAISNVRKNRNKPVFERLNENENITDIGHEEAEQINLLNRAISKLNYIDKAIILLWLEDKSYEEIASIMGTSKTNVSVKLVRIKHKLEELVNETEKQEL